MRRFGFSSSHFFSVPVLLALCHAMAGPVGRGDGTLSLLAGYRGLAGTMTYRSLHAAATWTFSEGERTLRRVRYRESRRKGSGTGQKCVSSPVAALSRQLYRARIESQGSPSVMPLRRHLATLR